MAFAQRLISTRRGTLTLAIAAAVLAGLLVLVYVSRYRSSVRADNAPVTVLVAKSTIPKGTPGNLLAAQSLFTVTTIRESQLRNGAFSDPSSLVGRAASHDIFPGQQLTAADFAASATSLASTLSGNQRVVVVPLDASHGLTADLSAGDRVDVYAAFNVTPVDSSGRAITGAASRPVLRLIMQNIQVAEIRSSGGGGFGGGGGSGVGLKVTSKQAANLAFASDNGRIWLTMRPASGAKPTKPDLVTVETLMLGVPAVAVQRALGARR
jgi:Flp pilus assembly protein CpaB